MRLSSVPSYLIRPDSDRGQPVGLAYRTSAKREQNHLRFMKTWDVCRLVTVVSVARLNRWAAAACQVMLDRQQIHHVRLRTDDVSISMMRDTNPS